jgi:hypothetical protein
MINSGRESQYTLIRTDTRNISKKLKEVGSWAFQFHCTGCYKLLLTGSTIPIPLVQAHVLLNSVPIPKKCASWNFERVLLGLHFGVEGYFSQNVRNLNDFTVSASSKKSSIFFLINKYFTYIIYDTSSWGLELTQMLHSTNLLIYTCIFFQIELRFFKKST